MRLFILSLSLLFTLSGCASLVLSGAATGGYVATQERSVGNAVDDTGIDAQITHKFLQSDINSLLPNVNTNIHEGRVLLTGDVTNEKIAQDAVRLVWEIEGVREVINEIQIVKEDSITEAANDQWINAQLDSTMLFTKGIRSVNYVTRVENGIVYLLGIAEDQAELDRVLRVASTIQGVKQVVSHVIFKDDPRRLQ